MKKTDFILYNGEKMPITDPVFGVTNRAIKFGDGFFESVLSYYEEVPFWGHHFERIKNAFYDYDMKTSTYSSKYLLNEILRLSKSNKFFGKVYTRISFFREDTGKYAPKKDSRVSYFMEQRFLGQQTFEINPKGLVLGCFTEYRKPVNRWSKYKKISADLFVFASMYSATYGFDDVFIVNDKGKIIETTHSNIFCLNENGKVYTPAISSGCVAGVMRRVIIDLLTNNSIEVVEVDGFEETDFEKAEELFLTNAIQGIKWVGAYKDKRFVKDLSVFLTEKLNTIYFNNL